MNDASAKSPAVVSRPPRRRILRRVATIVLFVALACGAVALWRATSIAGLPEIPDVFAPEEARIEISDEENAFTFYRRAHERTPASDVVTMLGAYKSWSQVDAAQLKALETERPSLEIWLEGTKRARGVYVQAADANARTMLPVTQRLRDFSRLADLQAFKLECEGDVAGSWAWLRANLRSGRHSGAAGFVIERLVGATITSAAATQAMRWSENPKVDAKLLRRALADLREIEAMPTSIRDTLRHTYFEAMNTLADRAMCEEMLIEYAGGDALGWKQRRAREVGGRLAPLLHEPERSRRVARLVFANWKSVVDLPAAERKKRRVMFGTLVLFRPAPGETPPIAIEELASWALSSRYFPDLAPVWTQLEAALVREQRTRADMIVHFAEQLYLREHGKPPARAADLIGPDLPALPEGYTPPEVDAKTPAGAAP